MSTDMFASHCNRPRSFESVGKVGRILVFAAFFLIPVVSPKADQPSLGLPVDCRLGTDCWLVNLVDLDPTSKVRDYACGRHGYDGHKGTDIAIRDRRAMDRGVPVIAAAAGTVRAFRDGMADRLPSAEFRKKRRNLYCGNGVVLTHADGWTTQYCHLRRHSVTVKRGQKVAKGDRLGYVGHSGMAEFPHIHLTVRHGKKVVDPFVGLGRKAECGPGPRPLWSAAALEALAPPLTAIYNVGFAPTKPKLSAIRKGLYQAPALSRRAPALILWAEIFWVRPGDRLRLTIVGPDDAVITEYSNDLPKHQARRMIFAGSKKKGLFWPAGSYQGTVVLERPAGNGPAQRFEASRRIVLKD